MLTLSYAARQLLFQHVPGWETMERMRLELDYIASVQRLESLITMNAKARYDYFRQANSALLQQLPAKIVSDYMGISPETLSRLKDKNVIC